MKLIFTNNNPVPDTEVQQFYEQNKDKEIVEISNSIILDRFRLGLKQGEIDNLELQVNSEIYKFNKDGNWFGNLPPELTIWQSILDSLIFE